MALQNMPNEQGDFGNEAMGTLNPVRNFDEAKAGQDRAVDKGKKGILSGIIRKMVSRKKKQGK